MLVVDRAGHGREGPGEKIAQPDFGPVKFGAAAARAPGADRHGVSAGVFLEPGNQVAAPVEQSGDDFAAGVIGIGDQEHRLRQLQGGEQEQQFVEQRPAVAVGEHQSFMNPGGQGRGLKARADLDQQRECLAGVAHEILRLGVGVRGLVEGFYGQHLAAGLGFFQAIGQQHQATVDPLHARMVARTTRTQVLAKASTQRAGLWKKSKRQP